ncbi:alpha/beta hydrolase [Caldivirga sp.]|jgi:dipeptidyl aminopeptidase/acylaminoacyl peptidase|uniref:alpha/beta hydrolase n=1 Tax=Caldivirga sp. TaxID=2080243 RepID=UPI003D0B2F9C
MLALLFHGKGSSPEKINWLTRPFRNMGFKVEAPKIDEVADGFSIGSRIIENENNPVITGGHSMGGTVALLLAAKYPKKVKCVVAVAAPVDRVLQLRWLEKGEEGSVRRALYNDIVARLSMRDLEESSPIRYINGEYPPVIYIRGSVDDIVPVEHLELLKRKANEYGFKVIELTIEGMGHTPRSQHVKVIEGFIKDNISQCLTA